MYIALQLATHTFLLKRALFALDSFKLQLGLSLLIDTAFQQLSSDDHLCLLVTATITHYHHYQLSMLKYN